jgi:hypothetical protein
MKRDWGNSISTVLLAFLPAGMACGEVVGLIDEGGDVDVTEELGSLSLEDMQNLITATDDLEIAGVLNAEGAFPGGDFSRDEGALAGKISGAQRYGREDGQDTKASGSRYGFVNGEETWIPAEGLSFLGLITTVRNSTSILTVTVTYSDESTETIVAEVPGVTTWIGFHKPGETITAIDLSDPPGGAFANYDDLALAFVESAAPGRELLEIDRTPAGELSLTFTGVLQESDDLENWGDLDPAPASPLVIAPDQTARFYRARPASSNGD